MEAKISLVPHTFIEHLLHVPGARETEKCARGPLPSRSLIPTRGVNKDTKHDTCSDERTNRKRECREAGSGPAPSCVTLDVSLNLSGPYG